MYIELYENLFKPVLLFLQARKLRLSEELGQHYHHAAGIKRTVADHTKIPAT